MQRMMALVGWVERGVAPERLVGAKYRGDDVAQGVLFMRPSCAYPALARLVGSDVDDEKSWVCGTDGVKEVVKERKWVHDEI